MAAQLARLAEVASGSPQVSVQVPPFDSPAATADHSA
jgi:hypothetical protein